MASSNYIKATQDEIIGSYDTRHGAIVSIKTSYANDYADMRARQLSALSYIVNGTDFDTWSDEIQSNVHWLMTTLSEEIVDLLPIVRADTERRLIDEQEKATKVAAAPPATRLNESRSEMLLKFIEQLSREQEAENQPA